MKQIFILLLTVFCLTGCDMYTSYHTSIDNQTNDTIKFYFEGQTKYMQGNLDSVICLPHTNHIYIKVDDCDYVSEFTCDSKINEDEVTVIVSGGKELIKNIWDSNNWNCYGSNRDGWVITFVVTESDLE